MGRYYENTAKAREYMGHITGFDIGKNPHRITCYYRGLESKRRRIRGNIRHLNFEVQVSSEACFKLGLETLADLKKVLKVNPYERIKFFNIGKINDPRTKAERKRWELFQEYCLRHGIHNARVRLKKDMPKGRRKNFDRDYGKTFDDIRISDKQITIDELLLKSFRRSMRDWFNS